MVNLNLSAVSPRQVNSSVIRLPLIMNLLPLPNLPDFGKSKVIRVFDKIRFGSPDDDEYGEFYWFAREYPRCFKHHAGHAIFRLKGMHEKFQDIHTFFEVQLKSNRDNLMGMDISHESVWQIYWDFEAYLAAISSALDILSRIVGTAYEEQTPVSFNKLCAKTNLTGPVDILRHAKTRWVSRMKDYRDCFTHYTPVDTLLSVSLRKYSDGWEVRGKLPVNPNARDILRFRYSRRVELLRYAISVYKHMGALDAAVGKEISKLHNQGQFPKRTQNLFFIGGRTRD